jgi:hypothetical protein
MATTTNTAAPAEQQQQLPVAPFVRLSELEGGKTQSVECVVFIKTFGAWNRGVSAGFLSDRAQWLYHHGFARPLNPAVDRVGLGGYVRK